MAEPKEDLRIPDLLSLREAAAELGLKRAMTHRLVQQGQLRGKKIDGTWVFRKAAVLKLKEQRT